MTCARLQKFQSTRPAWGATRCLRSCGSCTCHFNPRAPHGARLRPFLAAISPLLFQSTRPAWGATPALRQQALTSSISIHAPRMGRDVYVRSVTPSTKGFQSTRPAWGATEYRKLEIEREKISIHAPRMGRDPGVCRSVTGRTNFNPRAPHGARQQNCTKYLTCVAQFQQKIIYALFLRTILP